MGKRTEEYTYTVFVRHRHGTDEASASGTIALYPGLPFCTVATSDADGAIVTIPIKSPEEERLMRRVLAAIFGCPERAIA
jgi:hypothetical protein